MTRRAALAAEAAELSAQLLRRYDRLGAALEHLDRVRAKMRASVAPADPAEVFDREITGITELPNGHA